jgi:hypothetical protein
MSENPKVRSYLLLAITGLVVAYVRNFVQYRHYSWGSIIEFLGWWFIHYMAVGIVMVTSYVVINNTGKFFLKYKDSEEVLTWEQAIVYTSLTILVSSIFIFLLAHWGGVSDYDEW